MDWPKTLKLALSVLALAGIVVLYGNSIHASIGSLHAEAAAERRAHQASMETFRQEMLLFIQRQARVEGRFQGLSERETAGQ